MLNTWREKQYLGFRISESLAPVVLICNSHMNQNNHISKSLIGTQILKLDLLSCASSTPLKKLWKTILQIIFLFKATLRTVTVNLNFLGMLLQLWHTKCQCYQHCKIKLLQDYLSQKTPCLSVPITFARTIFSPNWTSEHQDTFSKPIFLGLTVGQDQAQINISRKHSSSSTTIFVSNYLKASHQMHISSIVQMHCLFSPDFRKGQRS